MRITLNKVSNARKEGKWGKLDIEYTRDGGKSGKRTLVAIGGSKDVMNLFREDDAVGADYEIELETVEKNGETYYNWVGAKKVAGGVGEEKKSYTAKSTYETPEERAKKNVYISRQNALTNAVSFVTAKDGKATVGTVIEVAKQFAQFNLLGDVGQEAGAKPAGPKAPEADGDADFDDDIPF